jgi:uncharacterized protein (DUF58 family)
VRKRPTRRAGVVTGVGMLLLLTAMTAQAGWLFVLAAAVLSSVAGSAITRQHGGSVEVVRNLPAALRVGDEVTVTLEVLNRGRRSTPLARIEDRFEAIASETFVCECLPAGQRVTVRVPTTARRRGAFASGEVVVSSGWPFGLFRSSHSIDAVSPAVVVPRWVELRSFPLLEPSSYPAEALHERARIGAGLDYLGVREYRPGDPRRLVHWRSTARRGRLVVREYEEEGLNRVALVLAGADDGDPPESSFEALVSAAASIARYALVTGHPVDLYRSDGAGGIARCQDADRVGVLEWLAEAHPIDAPLGPLVGAATARLGRHGTLVVLAPSRGRAAGDVPTALRRAQASQARAVAVIALSSTWRAETPADHGDALLGALNDRAHVRLLTRGEDLERQLQG